MNEFEKIFNEMNLDRALLPILFVRTGQQCGNI